MRSVIWRIWRGHCFTMFMSACADIHCRLANEPHVRSSAALPVLKRTSRLLYEYLRDDQRKLY